MESEDVVTERLAFPVVSVLVHNDRREVLLQTRTKAGDQYDGFRELPQGKLRWGETVLECASRELLEETGLATLVTSTIATKESIAGVRLLGLQDASVVSLVAANTYLAVCVVGVAQGEPSTTVEGGDPRWFSKDEISALLRDGKVFPLNIPMLKAYFTLDC